MVKTKYDGLMTKNDGHHGLIGGWPNLFFPFPLNIFGFFFGGILEWLNVKHETSFSLVPILISTFARTDEKVSLYKGPWPSKKGLHKRERDAIFILKLVEGIFNYLQSQ